MISNPPEHVLSAFRSSGRPAVGQPEQLGYAWDNGLRVGDVVYALASDTATWSARVREKLSVPGARVARPLLTTDGRYTVAGWKATQFVAGDLEKRVDETALLAGRLEAELADYSAPFAGTAESRTDVFAQAERAAWEETSEYYADLSGLPRVVGHADLLATTLYSGHNPPAIVEVVPTAAPRPKGYTTALVIVDGLINRAVDDAICDRFDHIEGLDQLLLRAAAYRRHVNSLHEDSRVNVRSEIQRVEQMLVSRVCAKL